MNDGNLGARSSLFFHMYKRRLLTMPIPNQKTLMGLRLSISALALMCGVAWAGSAGDIQSRVPPEKLEEAKSLQNPFSSSPEILKEGKKLYEGKAWCSACHGREGGGGETQGLITPPGAQPPTNFADAAWQGARSDGELFWILKHGSHGTDMAAFLPLYLSEEEAWKIVTYIRTFGQT
jgi:mono/diheme cytochrome c family protein